MINTLTKRLMKISENKFELMRFYSEMMEFSIYYSQDLRVL